MNCTEALNAAGWQPQDNGRGGIDLFDPEGHEVLPEDWGLCGVDALDYAPLGAGRYAEIALWQGETQCHWDQSREAWTDGPP